MALIKSLTVEKFRGVLDSTLPFDGKSLILHGENGCGKSSFVDAIEFFYKGEVSHLQGAEGVSLDRHGPHALCDKKDSRISIEFLPPKQPNETMARSFAGFDSQPVSLADHLALGAEAGFILRRRNLLGFIAAQAASRYDQLAELIGITDLDAVDLNLKRQTESVSDAVQAAKRRVRMAQTNLKQALDVQVDADETILAALNAKLATLGQQPLPSLSETALRKVTVVADAKSPQDMTRAVALQTAKTGAEGVKDSLGFLEKHAPLWGNLAAFQKDSEAMRDQVYQSFWASAAGLLESQRPTVCPVCQRPFDEHLTLEEVVKRIQTRLAALQATSQRYSDLQAARTELKAEAESFLQSLKECRSQIHNHLPQMDVGALDAVEKGIADLVNDLGVDVAQVKLKAVEEYLPSAQRTACAATLAEAIVQLQGASQQTTPTDKDRSAAKAVELLATVENERAVLRAAQMDVEAKSAVHAVISAVYERFLETKKAEVQRIFDNLQDDMRRFYDIIHPGEGHRAVSLFLSPGRRASAHIKIGFYHHADEDPRGYNSEAHLDSLGLCIFLAFAKRFNGGFPLIVLDDVVSSVDAAHRGRVCRLLCEEFSDNQLLITTHDYLWMEEWEAHQRALNLCNCFVNLRILDWSLDQGPTLDKYKARWELLQQKLADGDREGAASEARRILEWFLREMCFNTEAPVPLTRDGKYTVGQLYDPLLSRLKKLNKGIQADNTAVFQALQINGIFGNLLTHNNPQAGSASIAEVQAFAAAVTDFYNLFYCTNCRQLVKYDRDDKELKCQCKVKPKLWPTS